MRKIVGGLAGALVLVGLCISAPAQVAIYDCYNGSAERGGNRTTTNGIQSLQYVQQSYPGAQVDVYVHNTTNHATIFQDEAGVTPLANPFSASNAGVAFVCAADGRYDFKYSLGGIPVPFTVSDIKYCFSCSGGGGGSTTPFKQVSNCTASGTVLNETVQEATQVVAGVTQVCATVGQPNSTTIIGVCNSGCGNSGIANVAVQFNQACVMDNQAVANDYVVPSATIQGFCSDSGDAGSLKPAATVETLGIVSLPNVGGAGNNATVQLAPLSILLPGTGFCSPANLVYEVPSGLVNGSNTVYNLSQTPNPTNSLILWRNGQEQKQGLDYSLAGSVVTFSISAPTTGDLLYAFYTTGGVVSGNLVTSVFGRTGAIVATTGDYTAAQVTGAVGVTGSPNAGDIASFSASSPPTETSATASNMAKPLACADSSGSGSAQVCTTTPTIVSLVANQTCITYTTTTQNSGASLTLNVDTLSAGAHVAKWGGSSTTLTVGDIPANKPIPMCWDGTNWDAMTIGNAPAGGAVGSGESRTVSGAASMNFTTCLTSATKAHVFLVITSITAGQDLVFNASTNGGSSYDSTAGHYTSNGNNFRSVGTSQSGSGNSSSRIEMNDILTGTHLNTATTPFESAFDIVIASGGQASILGKSNYQDNEGSPNYVVTDFAGNYLINSMNAFQITSTSGNISGTGVCYPFN